MKLSNKKKIEKKTVKMSLQREIFEMNFVKCLVVASILVQLTQREVSAKPTTIFNIKDLYVTADSAQIWNKNHITWW